MWNEPNTVRLLHGNGYVGPDTDGYNTSLTVIMRLVILLYYSISYQCTNMMAG